MTDSTNVHHEINYIEFSATDLDEAKRFYAEAFGWRFNDYGPDYCGIRKQESDGETGGICRVDSFRAGGALVVLYSRNLEASCDSVRKAGGTITKEIFTFPGGRRFEFADPSGNELSVWSDQVPEA